MILSDTNYEFKAINRIQELCFIGALSYFEHAFRTLFSGSMRGFQSAL